MTQTSAATERNATLDRLANGSNCPACRTYADEPCRTPAGAATAPHAARIDRAVAQYKARAAAVTR